MIIRRGRNVRIFGHTWKWAKSSLIFVGYWESTDGNLVRIVPSRKHDSSWWVIVYDRSGTKSPLKIPVRGRHVAKRVFSIGVGYVTQDRKSRKAK